MWSNLIHSCARCGEVLLCTRRDEPTQAGEVNNNGIKQGLRKGLRMCLMSHHQTAILTSEAFIEVVTSNLLAKETKSR